MERDMEDDRAVKSPVTWSRMVTQYPVTTLVASFGLGIGMGVLAVAAFDRGRASYRSRDRWGRSIHDLTESLGELPGRIAEHLPELPSWR